MEFGIYADEIIYDLKATGFANEYFNMNNTKFLNEILQILGYYGSYEISED